MIYLHFVVAICVAIEYRSTMHTIVVCQIDLGK